MPLELSYNLFLIAMSIFILNRSAVQIVRSLIHISHFLKISEFTVSFILMAAATSLPEFGIGLNAALNKSPLISLGNILGANILVLSFILGLMILIEGDLKLKKHSPAHSSWLNFFLAVSPIVLLIDGELSRFDGLILISFFIANLLKLIRLRTIFQHHRFSPHYFEPSFNTLSFKMFFKNLFAFALAIALLLVSAYLIVNSVKAISLGLGFSEMLMGIFVVALSTTLPELSLGIRAALSKHQEMSLGNLLGAAVFNSTLILGVVSLISPIKIVEPVPFWLSAGFMILVVFLANLFLKTRDSLSRLEGLILILIYLAFVFIQLRGLI